MRIVYDPDLDGVVSAAMYLFRHPHAVLYTGYKGLLRALREASPGETIVVLDMEPGAGTDAVDTIALLVEETRPRLVLVDHHFGNWLARHAAEQVILKSPSTAAIVRRLLGLEDERWRLLETLASYSDLYKCPLLPPRERMLCWRLSITATSTLGRRLNELVEELAFGGLEPPSVLEAEAYRLAAETVKRVRETLRPACSGDRWVLYIAETPPRFNKYILPAVAMALGQPLLLYHPPRRPGAAPSLHVYDSGAPLLDAVRAAARRLRASIHGRRLKMLRLRPGTGQGEAAGVLCEELGWKR